MQYISYFSNDIRQNALFKLSISVRLKSCLEYINFFNEVRIKLYTLNSYLESIDCLRVRTVTLLDCQAEVPVSVLGPGEIKM